MKNHKIELPDYSIKDPIAYFKTMVKKQHQEDRIPIRINSAFKMHFKFINDEDRPQKNYFSQKI